MESIRPEATARKGSPNKVMREDVVPFLQEKGCRDILDFGAGSFCKDALYLASLGYDVLVKELPESIEKMDISRLREAGIEGVVSELDPAGRFDAVLLNYVLNVIPSRQERESVLHQVSHCLRPGGYAVVTVRPQGEVVSSCSHGKPYKDGYLMGEGTRRTFQHGFGRDELLALLAGHGLDAMEVTTRNGLTVIARKSGEDVLYGQTVANPGDISERADYLQVALSGKDAESIERLLERLPGKPLMLHGDYGDARKDNALFDDARMEEITRIIRMAKAGREVYGLTVHSPTKSFMRKNCKSLEDISARILQLQDEADVNVMLEHRSGKNFAVSSVDEILGLGGIPLTIDAAAMFVSLGYDPAALKEALGRLDSFSTVELHASDSVPGKQAVGAAIGEGKIPYASLALPPARYRTVEVLGSKRFERSVDALEGRRRGSE